MSVSYAVVVPARYGAGWQSSARPMAQVYARRRVIALLGLFTLVAGLWFGTSTVLANRGGVPASASAVRPDAAAAPLAAAASSAAASAAPGYIVQPGDTLWSIAARLRGGESQADYVAALVEVNGGASLQVGQVLRLP